MANQGENTETDVDVEVTIGRAATPIELEKTLDTIAAGETKPVEIPLAEQPPTGQNVPIDGRGRGRAGRGEDRQQQGLVLGDLHREG